MRVILEIMDYDPAIGIQMMWNHGFTIDVKVTNGGTVIKGNQAGLISLARHCLTLAQLGVSSGNHIHFDEMSGLEDGSTPLILQKIE